MIYFNGAENVFRTQGKQTAGRKMAKGKLKVWQKILIVAGVVAGVAGLCLGGCCIATAAFRKNYYGKEIAEKVSVGAERKSGALFTENRGIYDKNGNRVLLKGINIGNYLIQEGWLSVNSLGVKYDKNGNYVKINEDGIIEEYEETYQQEIDAALASNKNLTAGQIDELWETYYDGFLNESDFEKIAEVGFNTVRLPMYYRNFYEGTDENLTLKDNAFTRIDAFLENCKKHNLYAILDMHGLPGGQNGYEHSGSRTTKFWDNEEYISKTCELWKAIANRYSNEKSELYDVIACFDLVNEPEDEKTNATEKKQFDVQDRMYRAIREVDKEHIVSIAGCWTFDKFPSPEKYGWENVIYEIHLYNWNSQTISNDLFYFAQDFTHSLAAHDVPYFIGEFTFFDKSEEWEKWLDEYEKRGWNWCVWTYKAATPGWWDTSWGLYVYKMDLKNEKKKLDLRTAAYDKIKAEWENVGEKYTETGVLYEVMKKHLSK